MGSPMVVTLSLLVAFSLLLPSAFGGVICEDLPQDLCAFSISSSGGRCVWDSTTNAGSTEYHCHTSLVMAYNMTNWIENDECIRTCGVDRSIVGFSADVLLEKKSSEKLCSAACCQKCPNIIDLYYNLATIEGISLEECKAQISAKARTVLELNVDDAAEGPDPS